MAFTLPPLAYAYDALAPYIDKETLEIHHDKHHQAYVTNLNNAVANTPHADKSLLDLVRDAGSLPAAIRNNAGGHWNHSFFWEILKKNNGATPKGELLEAIKRDCGSLEKLKEEFNKAAMTRFGSGWAWLVVKDGKLLVTSSANQDNPIMNIADVQGAPIIGVDVWEHAYYLTYQNRRADYLAAFWSALNWEAVEQKFKQATKA